MNLIHDIVVLTVKPILLISSFLEEFYSNIAELSVGKNILLLLIIFLNFIAEFIKLGFKKICRAAIDDFFVAADFLSEFGVDIAGSFTVFTGNHILKFLGYHLIAFAEDDIENGLSADDLRGGRNEGRITAVLTNARNLGKNFIKLIFFSGLFELIKKI